MGNALLIKGEVAEAPDELLSALAALCRKAPLQLPIAAYGDLSWMLAYAAAGRRLQFCVLDWCASLIAFCPPPVSSTVKLWAMQSHMHKADQQPWLGLCFMHLESSHRPVLCMEGGKAGICMACDCACL